MRENGSIGRPPGPQGLAHTVQPSHHHQHQPLFIEYGDQTQQFGEQRWEGGEVNAAHPPSNMVNRIYKEGGDKMDVHGEVWQHDNPMDVTDNTGRQREVDPYLLSQQESSRGRDTDQSLNSTSSLGSKLLLETHFDSNTQQGADHLAPYHTRSSSFTSPASNLVNYSSANLNHSFPGCDLASSAPYISSSVTLPAVPQRQEGIEYTNGGFYQNVSGKIRQPSLRYKEEQRASFARQQELLHKSPRTQELEEFAAKFEGYQSQRTKRLTTQPTPMLDQLAREQHNREQQLWSGVEYGSSYSNHQLSALETNLLRLVQRNDSLNGRAMGGGRSDGDTSSGRESVTTVISNSSSDTLRFNERHSSSETLKYQELGSENGAEQSATDNAHDKIMHKFGSYPSQDFMAVKERNRSLGDENYVTRLEGDTWQSRFNKERDEPSVIHPEIANKKWDQETRVTMYESHALGSQHLNKRVLFRSHSESGSQNFRWDGEQQGIMTFLDQHSSNGSGTVSECSATFEQIPSANNGYTAMNELISPDQESERLFGTQPKRLSLTTPEESSPKTQFGEMQITGEECLGEVVTFPQGRHQVPKYPDDCKQMAQVPQGLPGVMSGARAQGGAGLRQKAASLQALLAQNCSIKGQEKCEQQILEKNTLPRMRSGTRTRKPKLPTPPCSPKFGERDERQKKQPHQHSTGKLVENRNCSTPSPPPPPPPSTDNGDQLVIHEPLPPPPADTFQDQKSNQRTNGGTKQNKQSGLSTPDYSTAASSKFKPPANTPKRDSPATIAAKEAPGWQMFLGMKSSTVSFTSAEATKFRAARDESRSRAGNKREESRGRNLKQEWLNQQEQEDIIGKTQKVENMNVNTRENSMSRVQGGVRQARIDVLQDPNLVGWEQIQTKHLDPANLIEKQTNNSEKRPKTRREEYRVGRNKNLSDNDSVSSKVKKLSAEDFNGSHGSFKAARSFQQQQAQPPSDERQLKSPNEKQHSLHLSRERSLKSISNWWKSSLEGGPTPPLREAWADRDEPGTPTPRHNHSHSDSGISSMSGRSSCMSPMSDLSSSSGSSRTSLRSSSIVSASNILIEEEEQGGELDYSDLCKELLIFAPPESRISSIIRSSLSLSLQIYFPENSLEFEIISNAKEHSEQDFHQAKRSSSSNFEDCRKKLLNIASCRIETQRKHQQLLKESSKANEDVGKEIITELSKAVGLASSPQPEVDKVKLFVEEVDKITSLIIGLSSRLTKANLACGKGIPAEKQQAAEERRCKLKEQLDEARKLRQSIFRRGDAVFNILAKYLDSRGVEAFGAYTKEKIRLILETRQHTEILKSEEDLLKCLKEYSSNGEMII